MKLMQKSRGSANKISGMNTATIVLVILLQDSGMKVAKSPKEQCILN
jgi:hypothetical protein